MVQDMVLDELSSNHEDTAALQSELLPTYQALPKNENGLVDPATARYALHRHFVHKYGWYVRGLDPKKSNLSITEGSTVTKDRLPQHVQSLFHKDKGVDLVGLASFGHILTKLMEDEVNAGLDEIVEALQMNTENISDSDFDKVVEGYLARVILGAEEQVESEHQLQAVIVELGNVFSGWPDTVMWGMDTIHSFEWRESNRRNPFVQRVRTFDDAIPVVRGMMHKFNELNYVGCAAVKRELVAKEVAGSGRINLVDFYSDFQRKRESVDYLRNIGALDESDPERPTLLIANFIVSSSNCLVDASYYSSCCANECEGLLGHLERNLAAPEVKPESIAALVSQLPSDSVLAPRNLSATLLSKLHSIADMHGGKVPLHGRLFSQWMHHAYPRECPFPQVSGNSTAMTQDEFMDHHDLDDVFVHDSQIKKQKELWKLALHGRETDVEAPWDEVEELVAQQHRAPRLRELSLGGLRVFVAFALLGSLAFPLVRSTSKLCHGFEDDFKKQLV